MMGKTHVAGGAMAWVVVAPFTGATWQEVVVGTAVAGVAGLGPDIDHPTTSLGRVIPWVSRPLSKVTKHRVHTHSIASVVAIWLVFGVIDPVMAAATSTGWGSHIVLDAFTRQGVAWFWPLTREKTSLFFFLPFRLRPRTNGVSETVFAGIMSVTFMCYEAYVLVRLIIGWRQ